MQFTVPQFTIGILRFKPHRRLYLEIWSCGSFMLGLWRVIVFLTVWPKQPQKGLHDV